MLKCLLGAWALKLNEREITVLETFNVADRIYLTIKHQVGVKNWDVKLAENLSACDRISRTGTLNVIGSEMTSVTPVNIKERIKEKNKWKTFLLSFWREGIEKEKRYSRKDKEKSLLDVCINLCCNKKVS